MSDDADEADPDEEEPGCESDDDDDEQDDEQDDEDDHYGARVVKKVVLESTTRDDPEWMPQHLARLDEYFDATMVCHPHSRSSFLPSFLPSASRTCRRHRVLE